MSDKIIHIHNEDSVKKTLPLTTLSRNMIMISGNFQQAFQSNPGTNLAQMKKLPTK